MVFSILDHQKPPMGDRCATKNDQPLRNATLLHPLRRDFYQLQSVGVQQEPPRLGLATQHALVEAGVRARQLRRVSVCVMNANVQ
jgi:hypothetical protein